MAERQRDDKGRFLPSHNGTNTQLYKVWCAMKRRCYSPQDKRYCRYGGRGITVCDEWVNDFAAFRVWSMGNGYCKGLTIVRIDNNGSYSPDNCRWVTHSEQNRNYSRNHFITYNGKTMCITDWEKETGINRATILLRLKAGRTIEEVFEKRDRRFK